MAAENKRIASEETLVRVAEALESMASAQLVNLSPQSWEEVQQVVRKGLASKVFAIGDQFVVERAKSASATVVGSGVTTASVSMIAFIARLGFTRSGFYDFEYSSSAWCYAGELVELSQYGITVTGTPVKGDTITVWLTTEEIVFDVIGIDHDTPSDPQFTHSLTIGLHDLHPNVVQFDAQEALFYVDTPLSAGTYNFKLPDGYDVSYGGGQAYQFTLTKPVPQGGVITFPWGHKNSVTSAKISTYESRGSYTPIESVSLMSGASGTALETKFEMNDITRVRYGSNNYNESNIRQWMNSDAANGEYWSPQTLFDRPPSLAKSLNGFLYGLDKSFVDVVGNVKKLTGVCGTNTPLETDEKFFLPSCDELFFTESALVNQGYAYAYYENYSDYDKPERDADSNRIKYRNDGFGKQSSYYFLRSPDLYSYNASGTLSNVRFVAKDGSITNTSAASTGGVLVTCCIV